MKVTGKNKNTICQGIEVTVISPRACLPAAFIARISRKVLKEEKVKNAVLTVVLAQDAFVRRLNRKYKSRDSSTDVLSFDLTPRFLSKACVIADVVVSADVAMAVAKNRDISFKEELARYVVHGILHLTGHNDASPPEKNRMWKRQEELLKRIKVV